MPIKDYINGIKIAADLLGVKDTVANGIHEIKQEINRLRTEYNSEALLIDNWDDVFEAIDQNTYKDKFKIGDYIMCDFGKEGCVYMQIAAFDRDILSSQNGKAAITWVGKYCLLKKREMNESGYWLPIISNKGGWKKTDMRMALNDVLDEVEAPLYHRIVYVNKKSGNDITNDAIWLLSIDEYNEYKMNPRISFDGNESFWLRDSVGKSKFGMVFKTGGIGNVLANVKDGVLVCFCTN